MWQTKIDNRPVCDVDSVDYLRIVEFTVAIAGGLSAAGAFLYASHRFAGYMFRNWATLHRLHRHFGDDPVSALAEILSHVETTTGELDIRQQIAARFLQVGVYVCDPEGGCTWVNDVLADAFQLDSQEALGHGWLSAISKRDQRRVYANWKHSVQNDLHYKESYTVEPENGEAWRAETQAWPVRNQSGKVLCYVGYIRKVDE